jgi:hypothetical protein
MPICNHDVRVQKDGSKFCQKCFSELPIDAETKADEYQVKLRRDKITAQAKRKRNVDTIVDRSGTRKR